MSDILTKPKITIAKELKSKIKEQADLEKQVIVHCKIKTPASLQMGIRIWPTTFLFDHTSEHKSQLVHQENIPLMPGWKSIPSGSIYTFTLIFNGLPRTCYKFHLIELTPQTGGFESLNIIRNKTDVYTVEL